MKTRSLRSLTSLALAILTTGFASAATVSRTFTGVITTNYGEGAITREFPVGTVWRAVVEWESASAPMGTYDAQAQYRLSRFSLSFKGTKGNWSTSARVDKPSFTLNHLYGGIQHEMQFTSGWGPSSHTNPKIANFQPYSINIVLKDPTGKAIPSLTPAPTAIDSGAWSATDSYFKLYLNNEGNRYLVGSVNLPTTKEAEISVQQPAGTELVDGTSRCYLGRAKVRTKSTTKTFTIHNTGKARLTKLALTKIGRQKGDFVVGPLSATSLAPNAKARFTVTFNPKAKGKRGATIRIASNDKDENPFDIQLTGVGN